MKTLFFVENKFPSSKEMAQLSYEKYKKNDIEDVAYFEPFYLKNFVAVPQKKTSLTFFLYFYRMWIWNVYSGFI